MELQGASLAQVRTGRDGKRVLIEDDVLDIARQVRELDDSLLIHWNEYGRYFVISERCADGAERLVTTTTELTPALIERLRKIVHPSYDYAGELDRSDREAQRERERLFAERVGEHGEQLAYALRKDTEHQGKVFLPRGIDAT